MSQWALLAESSSRERLAGQPLRSRAVECGFSVLMSALSATCCVPSGAAGMCLALCRPTPWTLGCGCSRSEGVILCGSLSGIRCAFVPNDRYRRSPPSRRWGTSCWADGSATVIVLIPAGRSGRLPEGWPPPRSPSATSNQHCQLLDHRLRAETPLQPVRASSRDCAPLDLTCCPWPTTTSVTMATARYGRPLTGSTPQRSTPSAPGEIWLPPAGQP